ncbi:MAG: hypothetical protein JWO05_2962 [Gemmatimonadetes bacterium]|nr:hypothetical protein [Gemmatimonadota bacterium]
MTSNIATARAQRLSRAAGIIGFAIALAASAQVAIPLPGTPVPLTLQPLLVVLAGLFLGPVAGAGSMLLYLVAGAVGLPVFAPMGAPGVLRLLGPTGGYLLAYPAAAWVAGRVGANASRYAVRLAAAAAGMAVLYAGGLAQLAIITGSVQSAVTLGFLQFAALDAVKTVIAAAVTRPSRSA